MSPGRLRRASRSAGGEPLRRYTVVKTWFQDDYGLFARFDSLLCRALARHPQVDKVIHLAPPLPPHELRRRGSDGYWEANLDRLTARATGDGFEDEGVWLFTAPVGETLAGAAAARSAEVVRAQAVEGSWLVVVEMLTAQEFPAAVVDRLPDAIRVAILEDDHRVGRADASELSARFRATMDRAAFGLVSSPVLMEEFQSSANRLSLIPRVTEPEVYAGARPSAELLDLPRPLALYAGWLRDRIDYPLLREVVDACPDITFVLAGGGQEIAESELKGRANVLAIGPRPGAAVPHLLAAADVLLVPHLVDHMTEGMTPDKVIHYLASGVPIVSTPVAGVRSMPAGLVDVRSDAPGFVAGVRAALEVESTSRAEGRQRRLSAVSGLTLDALADWFVASLDASIDGGAPPGAPVLT